MAINDHLEDYNPKKEYILNKTQKKKLIESEEFWKDLAPDIEKLRIQDMHESYPIVTKFINEVINNYNVDLSHETLDSMRNQCSKRGMDSKYIRAMDLAEVSSNKDFFMDNRIELYKIEKDAELAKLLEPSKKPGLFGGLMSHLKGNKDIKAAKEKENLISEKMLYVINFSGSDKLTQAKQILLEKNIIEEPKIVDENVNNVDNDKMPTFEELFL